MKSLSVVIMVLLLFPTVIVLQDTEAEETNYRIIVVPDDYTTIQAALDASVDGDTVFVKKGTYYENPTVYKPITLMGEDMDSTIINAGKGLTVKRDNVTVAGFTINGTGPAVGLLGGNGISLQSSYCNISNNKIANATHGLKLFTSKNNIITANIFESIKDSAAIQLNSASDNNQIENNHISYCTEGIHWLSSNNNTAKNNTITNCEHHAIRLQYSTNNIIMFNNLTHSGAGTSILGSNGNVISNNNYIGNKVQLSTEGSLDPSLGYGISVNNTINQNYWSNYSGTDSDSDGIGDTPYIIDAYNQDNNPLMKQIDFTNTSPISTPIPTPSAAFTSIPSATLPLQSPTTAPSLTPDATATVPEFTMWTLLIVLVIVATVGVTYRSLKKNIC